MYSTYFSFLWKQPQYKYKQYIYTYRLSFNIQHNRFNRITLLLFLIRGKQKKKKTCHRAASRRTVKKKKNKTKQNKKTALLARSNALLWELTISYLAVVIPIVLYYIVDCGTSRYTAVLHSFYIDSLFFFVDIKI